MLKTHKPLSDLFHWLWPQIVQIQLDKFVHYWNSHKVRYQGDKKMPSGATPNHIFTCPHLYGGERLGQRVPREATKALRESLEVPREEALRWVSSDFAEAAERVYKELGSPEKTLAAGWSIFADMTRKLE